MHLFVVDVVALLLIAHFDLLAEVWRRIADGCQATAANLGARQYGEQAAVQLKKFAMEDVRMKMRDGGCSNEDA